MSSPFCTTHAAWTSATPMTEEGLTRDTLACSAHSLVIIAAFHQEAVVIRTRSKCDIPRELVTKVQEARLSHAPVSRHSSMSIASTCPSPMTLVQDSALRASPSSEIATGVSRGRCTGVRSKATKRV